MSDELQTRLGVIRDMERAIRVWELLRDNLQRVLDDANEGSEIGRNSAETDLNVARAQAYIDLCKGWILAAKVRIDALASED